MSNDSTDPRFQTRIPRSEWEQVNRLRSAVGDDERKSTGRIHLSCDGKRRVWEASNSYRALQFLGGDDAGVYSVSLPPMISSYASIASVRDGETELEVSGAEAGPYEIVLSGAGGVTSCDLLRGEAPDLSEFFARDEGSSEATVDIQDFRYLWSLIGQPRDRAASNPRTPDDEQSQVGASLFISSGFAGARVHHEDLGITVSSVPAETTGVYAARMIGHDNLKAAMEGIEMLIAFGSDAAGIDPPYYVTIVMPEDEDSPVQFFGRDVSAVVMPWKSHGRMLRHHVESVINECYGFVATERDSTGDYPLFLHRAPVFGRLDTDANPAWLQVFTVVLSNVECTPDLLKELNDLNQHMSYAPLYHEIAEDGTGQVVSEIDLLAETLDPAELRTAVERIHELAISMSPTLAAVFGGEPVEDPAEHRWAEYRTTVVEAELVPDAPVAITGEAGVEPWPFPGTVYVITGWNPQGVSLGDERHDYINQQIAEDVVSRGGRYVMGAGRSIDGEHSEPSVIAWRITRADAIEMGGKANQDAVFEIDANELRLIACRDARVEARPRRAP